MLGRASHGRPCMMAGITNRHGAEPQARSGVTCDQCGVVCPSAIHLARHLVSHDDDRPGKQKITYECASCDRTFRFLKQLTGHQETCRGKARSSSLISSTDVVTAMPSTTTAASSSFRCGLCGRQFTQCGALRRHERVHSGERPHACKTCGKRFTQKCTLDRHVMLVHDGIDQGVSGRDNGGTDKALRTPRQSRSAPGNRRGGGDGSLVAAASATADGAAITASLKRQSRGRRGGRDGIDSALVTSFALDRSRREPSPPSLFSDDEGDDKVNSNVNSMASACGVYNEPATVNKATSSLSTNSFDEEDHRKHVASQESTSSSSSSDSDDSGGSNSNSDASFITSAGAADDPRRPHKCTRCGFAFKLAAHLKQHITALHSGGMRPYACDECDRRYRTQGALHSHKVMHSQKMRYRCHKCGCRFARKWSLQRHVVMHGLKPLHRCLLCGQRFVQVENLELHLRSTHAGERPHRCAKCNSRFATAAKLRRHASSVHGTRSVIAGVNRQSKRPVSSDLGAVPLAVAVGGIAARGTALASTDALFVPDAKRLPKVEPTGDSNTSDVSIVSDAGCSRSKAKASGTANSSRRSTNDSGTTPEMKDSFECRMCSCRFSCKRNLTRHEKAHIAPRLHGCLVCGKCFTQRGNLNRHLRKVHQPSADKLSATADVGRSQTSDNDVSDNVDRSNLAGVVADRRKLHASSRSIAGASRVIACSQAKAASASKVSRRPCVSGQSDRSANTGAVEIAGRGGCTTASGSSSFDDDFPVDNHGSEVIVGSDLAPLALSSPSCDSSKISSSTTTRENNSGNDDSPSVHCLTLNVDAAIERPAKPSVHQFWWEQLGENSRESADAIDRSNSPLELTVAEKESGSRRLPPLEFDGATVGRPLSFTVCHLLLNTSDVSDNSEVQAVSSVADSPRNESSPAPCVELPHAERRATASVGLDREVSGVQPPSSSPVGEVIDSSRSKEGNIADIRTFCAGLVKNADECVDSASKPRSPHSDNPDLKDDSATCLWDEVFKVQ